MVTPPMLRGLGGGGDGHWLKVTWSATFDVPITMTDGRRLRTLREAGDHISTLPEAEQKRPEWQAAIEVLILVAERDGPTMMARIGVLRALNHGKPDSPSEPRRKRAKAYRLIK